MLIGYSFFGLLGDQLEILNIRRQRAAQARDMMVLFDKFCSDAEDMAELQEWLEDTTQIYSVS
jgi:hypothetical protein